MKLSLLSKRSLVPGTTTLPLLSGAANALLVVSAAGNAGMPWAVPGLTPAAHYIVNQPLSNNGNTHANRPTSDVSDRLSVESNLCISPADVHFRRLIYLTYKQLSYVWVWKMNLLGSKTEMRNYDEGIAGTM